MSSHKKHAPLPLVKGKNGAKSRRLSDQLDFINTLLLCAAKLAVNPALAAQLTVLATARDTVVAAVAAKAKVATDAITAETNELAAVQQLGQALTAVIVSAEAVANGDPAVLASFGIPASKRGLKGAQGPVAATAKLKVGPGVSSGFVDAKCAAVVGSGSYIFQYKLEPSLPTDPWLPPMGAVTKYTKHTFEGLPAEQQVRVRACAVGAAPGPWSLEVVGRAK